MEYSAAGGGSAAAPAAENMQTDPAGCSRCERTGTQPQQMPRGCAGVAAAGRRRVSTTSSAVGVRTTPRAGDRHSSAASFASGSGTTASTSTAATDLATGLIHVGIDAAM